MKNEEEKQYLSVLQSSGFVIDKKEKVIYLHFKKLPSIEMNELQQKFNYKIQLELWE